LESIGLGDCCSDVWNRHPAGFLYLLIPTGLLVALGHA
jgi:hypothetical protein